MTIPHKMIINPRNSDGRAAFAKSQLEGISGRLISLARKNMDTQSAETRTENNVRDEEDADDNVVFDTIQLQIFIEAFDLCVTYTQELANALSEDDHLYYTHLCSPDRGKQSSTTLPASVQVGRRPVVMLALASGRIFIIDGCLLTFQITFFLASGENEARNSASAVPKAVKS